eukprot:jgi/Undpi1/8476/HiC_scaffold_25.g10943.m1
MVTQPPGDKKTYQKLCKTATAANAMSDMPDATDALTAEESEAHEVRRLRWILRVANNPGSCEEWYLGDEREGVRHGIGAAFFTSGDVYQGEWQRGLRHGRGTLTQMSGAKYTGGFEKGEQHGLGEFIDVDGVRFRGEYRRGVRCGQGLMVSPSGARFEGWFLDGLAHGDGILTWPDGGKFIGKYVAGKEHGRGAILEPLGRKVCDVECAEGLLVGGRTVCQGSLGGGKGPKCRGGSQSCGFCLQTAIDLELSIEDEEPDALQALSAGVGGLATTGGGAPMYGGSHGPPQCVVKWSRSGLKGRRGAAYCWSCFWPLSTAVAWDLDTTA